MNDTPSSLSQNLITKGLPLETIKKVNVEENQEELVEIKETPRLTLLSEHTFLDPRIRKSVANKLVQAANNLPDGYTLLLITAYRPIWMQRKLWRQRLWQMAKHEPFKMIFHFREWKRTAQRYTSPPGGSSHQCGAAVDVTVIDPKGNRLDMGTSLTAFGEKCNSWHDSLTDQQKTNRKLLYDAMIQAGFVNYPLEWWHYSYGDRMWAAYSNRAKCFYGPLNK